MKKRLELRVKTAAISMLIGLSVQVAKSAEPVKYPADPEHGFSHPYYLFIPPGVDRASVLVVEPNNTGFADDTLAVHDEAARRKIESRRWFAGDLRSPFLVPVFPRPASLHWVYTHALNRDCLTNNDPGLQRLDLQLLAMIADARARLAAQDLATDSRVFMMGFSASGMFANRFTILHPGSVKAAAVGAPGGWPIVPSAEYSGEELTYQVGISDLGALTGAEFNLPLYAAVPHFFFIGSEDTNDANPPGDNQINRLFGTTPLERWPVAEGIYSNAGCRARFVTYAGVGHNFTGTMQDDIKRFFYPDRRFLRRGVRVELAMAPAGGDVRVEWVSLPGLTYGVESSTDLRTWLDAGLGTVLGDGYYQTRAVAAAHGGAKFFRINTTYLPEGGGQGRFFNFMTDAFIVICDGLDSGAWQSSAIGSGTFTYADDAPGQATLVLDFPDGGRATFVLSMATSATGTYQGTYVRGGSTAHLSGECEWVRTP